MKKQSTKNKKQVSKRAVKKSIPPKANFQDFEFHSFAGNVAEIPIPSAEFYIEELMFWLKGETVSPYFEYPRQDKDYLLEWGEYPPPIPDADNPEKLKYEFYKSISSFDKIDKKKSTGVYFLKGILDAVKNNLQLLVTAWANHLQIPKYISDTGPEGEIKCIENLLSKLQSALSNKNQDFIPKLFHNRYHGHLLSWNCRSEKLDAKVDDKYFELGFSKTTALTFVKSLSEILESRNRFLYGIAGGKATESNLDDEKITKGEVAKMSLRYLKTDKKKIEISRSELAILFKHLQKQGIIIESIPNSSLSKIAHYLTGFDAENFRQFLSTRFSSKSKTDYIQDLELLEAKIISLLQAIQEEIKKEKQVASK